VPRLLIELPPGNAITTNHLAEQSTGTNMHSQTPFKIQSSLFLLVGRHEGGFSLKIFELIELL
jgi:hypothetical protein